MPDIIPGETYLEQQSKCRWQNLAVGLVFFKYGACKCGQQSGKCPEHFIDVFIKPQFAIAVAGNGVTNKVVQNNGEQRPECAVDDYGRPEETNLFDVPDKINGGSKGGYGQYNINKIGLIGFGLQNAVSGVALIGAQ